MRKEYYVNKDSSNNPNYNHEVHTADCHLLPSPGNRDYLGFFSHCSEALREAKKRYNNVDGCIHCCPECHRR